MISIFKNDEGSTTLTVVVAIFLVAALMALSLQWFWIKSSSSDIQYLADMGALTAMESISRCTKAIQILDLMIASLNFFGLVLHGVVVLAGVVMLTSSGLGGSWLSPFLEKAVEFNKKFIDVRKNFSEKAYFAAEKIADATPLIAYGYSANFVKDNASLLEKTSGTNYQMIIVPFPMKGSLNQGAFVDESSLSEQSEQAGEDAKTSTEKIQSLETARDIAFRKAYDLDVYKNSQTFETWGISDAIRHFKEKFVNLCMTIEAETPSVAVIDSNSVNGQARLSESYRSTRQDLLASLENHVLSCLGPEVPLLGRHNPGHMNFTEIYTSILDGEVYLLEHFDGERKAYHRISNCQGLSNAQSVLNLTTIQAVIDDYDHPPCSLCLPAHWEAVSDTRKHLNQFQANWNAEADAILAYESLKAESEEEKSTLRNDIQKVFQLIVDEAKDILKSGRISYQPPGSRGLLSVVISTNTRKLPVYTLPSLTGGSDLELGTQLALAGVRMVPEVDEEKNKSSFLRLSGNLREEGTNLSSSLYMLLGNEASLTSSLRPLWDMCASSVANGRNDFKDFFDDLPFGLSPIGENLIQGLTSSLGISKPDLRTFKPVLVNTSQVGSEDAPGVEGAFVSSLKESKKWYASANSIHIDNFSELLSTSINSYGDNFSTRVRSVLPAPLPNGGIQVPFNTYVSSITTTELNRLKANGKSWLALMGFK